MDTLVCALNGHELLSCSGSATLDWEPPRARIAFRARTANGEMQRNSRNLDRRDADLNDETNGCHCELQQPYGMVWIHSYPSVELTLHLWVPQRISYEMVRRIGYRAPPDPLRLSNGIWVVMQRTTTSGVPRR